MNYYVEERFDYSSTHRKAVNLKAMIDDILNQHENNGGYVDTIVQSLPDEELHLLVLDCDNHQTMLAAAHWIKTEISVNYNLIVSSDADTNSGQLSAHYWVVTDFIGSWKNTIYHLNRIPGVDVNFARFCGARNKIYIRADTKLVGNRVITPTFQDCQLTNQLAKQWYKEFRDFYSSPEYTKIKKSRILRAGLENDTILDLAADPNFVV